MHHGFSVISKHNDDQNQNNRLHQQQQQQGAARLVGCPMHYSMAAGTAAPKLPTAADATADGKHGQSPQQHNDCDHGGAPNSSSGGGRPTSSSAADGCGRGEQQQQSISSAKLNKAQMKNCLQLNLLSLSNCHSNACASNNGILSPWQPPPRSRRAVPRLHSLFPVNIMPNLFLGNDETARDREVLDKHGIRFVLNVTCNLPNYFEHQGDVDIEYKRIPVDDNSSFDLAEFFPEAISFIERARSARAAVLVHCYAGISRSVTVCLAYLMFSLQCTLEEAFDMLLKRNGTIAPNFHFMEALTHWERALFAASFSSTTMGINIKFGEGGDVSSSSKQQQQQQKIISPSLAISAPRSPSFAAQQTAAVP